MNDSISRQAVINELFDMANEIKMCEQVAFDNIDRARIGACKSMLIELRKRVAKLPTTQTDTHEPLTDNEQRIFLAAMSREEKVCKDIDRAFLGLNEPDTFSLVKICKEIMRKVKGSLWTN